MIGGVFGALATDWSEQDQEKINQALEQRIEDLTEAVAMLTDKLSAVIVEKDKAIFIAEERGDWVIGYIKLNPNTMQILEASRISSLADSCALDCTINFVKTASRAISMQAFGNGPVHFERVDYDAISARIRFSEPCPDKVTLVFFNL